MTAASLDTGVLQALLAAHGNAFSHAVESFRKLVQSGNRPDQETERLASHLRLFEEFQRAAFQSEQPPITDVVEAVITAHSAIGRDAPLDHHVYQQFDAIIESILRAAAESADELVKEVRTLRQQVEDLESELSESRARLDSTNQLLVDSALEATRTIGRSLINFEVSILSGNTVRDVRDVDLASGNKALAENKASGVDIGDVDSIQTAIHTLIKSLASVPISRKVHSAVDALGKRLRRLIKKLRQRPTTQLTIDRVDDISGEAVSQIERPGESATVPIDEGGDDLGASGAGSEQIANLKSSDWRKRKKAVEALAHRANRPGIRRAVLEKFFDTARTVRGAAAQVIKSAVQSDTALVREVLPFLESSNPGAREAAVKSLAFPKLPENHREAVISHLNDFDINVRSTTVAALGIWWKDPVVLSLLDASLEDEALSRAASDALLELRENKVVEELLLVAISNKSWKVRKSAIFALGLWSAHSDPYFSWAWRLPPEGPIRDALLAATGDVDSEIRMWAVSAIGQAHNDPQVRKRLLNCVEDSQFEVSRRALEALKFELNRKEVATMFLRLVLDSRGAVASETRKMLIERCQFTGSGVSDTLATLTISQPTNVAKAATKILSEAKKEMAQLGRDA